jgi:very-short-patch-repair endonuclease
MGRGAVLTHWSAAATWCLAQPSERLIDVTMPDRKRQSRPGIHFHRMDGLEPRDLRRRDGLPVTSVARTLLDLAPLAPSDHLARMYNNARIHRLIRDNDLAQLVERSRGHAGVPSLRLLLAHGSPGPTRSAAEDRFLSLVRSAGLPLPEANQHVAGHEVDFHWPGARLVVEIDGFAFHSTRTAFEADRRRDADLLAAGYRVLRLTLRSLDSQPEAVAARLAAALAA